ncbi:retropepsin-like aspartic protease [Anaerobaca lacustris]|uniref:Retropepsin-like aspartic protease n=1 Tax=Anaerobaca lacustris TaxID=3044600 RepID=A0AAW6U199_9BACT|nr:retropepsin-like aspartic protease [Sedimentisphaerales bacterium M17dextr]
MKTAKQTAARRACAGVLIVLLTLVSALSASTEGWQRRDVDWQAGGGRRIKGIHHPEDRPVPLQSPRRESAERSGRRSMTLYSAPAGPATAALTGEMLVESPPVDGFVPWIAVSVTTRRKAELEFEADVETSVRGSYPAGVNPQTDYIIGLFDTGASAHVMGYADGLRAGVYPGLLTANETIISGVTGSVVASVTKPLALFIDGLGAIDPETLLLDSSNMMGESNVAIMVGQNPGPLPDLPTAIGAPMSVYYTTVIRNDRMLTVERNGVTFTAPDIRLYETGDPQAPRFSTVIPLELRPLGGISVQYIPTLDMGLGGLDLDDILGGGFGSDFPPASPSIIIGNSSQSLFFVHSVDLHDGEQSAMDKNRFMLDTGAQVTVVGSRIAARLQLDPSEPEFEVEIQGVTGDITMAPGYYVDAIDIPALGQWFRARQIPVVLLDISSPEGGTLDGIIGMNLFVDFNLIVRGGGLFLDDDPALELQRIVPGQEADADAGN